MRSATLTAALTDDSPAARCFAHARYITRDEYERFPLRPAVASHDAELMKHLEEQAAKLQIDSHPRARRCTAQGRTSQQRHLRPRSEGSA